MRGGTPDHMGTMIAGPERGAACPPVWWLRDKAPQGGPHDPDVDLEDEEEDEFQRVLFCKSCGRMITSEKDRLQIDGAHNHTFFNPAGIVYELGCFKTAPGCSIQGEATSEFSWFAGYHWRVALCGGCTAHLGWHFMSGTMAFFGLIIKNLSSG